MNDSNGVFLGHLSLVHVDPNEQKLVENESTPLSTHGFMCDIHGARHFLESTFSTLTSKNRSFLSQYMQCCNWFWIHIVMMSVLFQPRSLSVYDVYTEVFQSHGVAWLGITIGTAEETKVFHVLLTGFLAQGIYQFPWSWSNLWNRERERRGGDISEVKWAK